MSTIEFIIKGLAACYRKDGEDFWNFVFPTDKNHVIKFEWTQGEKTYGPIELAGKSATISSPDSLPPVAFEDSGFIKYTIDLTADYLHSQGIKMREMYQMQVAETTLKIPHATLSSISRNEGRLNYVFPFNDPGQISLIRDKDDPSKPQIFSNLIGGKIDLKDGGKITINIDGEEPIVLSEGDAFAIDNDCHGSSERNDFQLYQDIFENKASSGKRFEMISIFDPNAKVKKHPFTDPPPLICNGVRISLPEDLD